MSEVINFPRRQEHRPLHPAVVRMQGLANVLSDLDALNLRTQDDMRRALWILDLTNRCVQIILTDFEDDPQIREFVRQAEELTASIERARFMVRRIGPCLPNAAVPRQ